MVKGAGGLPDELLYGRMGYLYSLVFVNQQLGQDRIPLQYIQQVSEEVFVCPGSADASSARSYAVAIRNW